MTFPLGFWQYFQILKYLGENQLNFYLKIEKNQQFLQKNPKKTLANFKFLLET